MTRTRRATASRGVRDQIIETAERLFSRRAFDAVSLREIAAAAGQGNTNAVQYHFGSKDGLIQAIFESHLDVLDQRRNQMLLEAERNGRLKDVRTLLNILCMPLLEHVDQDGCHIYAGFLAHYLLGYQPTERGSIPYDIWLSYPALRHTLDLLEERLSYVPKRIRWSRIEAAALSFYNLLLRSDSEHLNRTEPAFFAALIDDALETITVSLCAPYRYPEM